MKGKTIIRLSIVLLFLSGFYNIYQYYQTADLNQKVKVDDFELNQLKSTIKINEDEIYKLNLKTDSLEQVIKFQNERWENRKLKLSGDSEGLQYKALVSLKIRSQMTSTATEIGEVPKGATVTIVNSLFPAMWKISYDGIVGWVNTKTGEILHKTSALEKIE